MPGLICLIVCSQRTAGGVARLKPIPDGGFAGQDDRECPPYFYDFTGGIVMNRCGEKQYVIINNVKFVHNIVIFILFFNFVV